MQKLPENFIRITMFNQQMHVNDLSTEILGSPSQAGAGGQSLRMGCRETIRAARPVPAFRDSAIADSRDAKAQARERGEFIAARNRAREMRGDE